MRALFRFFKGLARTILTLGDGLAVTFSYLFRKPVTLQYPDRTALPLVASLPKRSRGLLEVDLDLCTACAMCNKTCPIDCIKMEMGKDESGGRLMLRLDIEANKCMYCGLCVEVCPTGAIRHSHEFEAAMGDVDQLVLHFIDKPRSPAKPPKKGEPVPEKPLGSLVRAVLPPAFHRTGCPASRPLPGGTP
jgi:formate hydrogenlyase subunit 6/NADH:ubiquinone oxidoreductase subunit I